MDDLKHFWRAVFDGAEMNYTSAGEISTPARLATYGDTGVHNLQSGEPRKAGKP